MAPARRTQASRRRRRHSRAATSAGRDLPPPDPGKPIKVDAALSKGSTAPALVWSPVVGAIRSLSDSHGGLRVLVAPFASAGGLERLLEGMGSLSDLRVICRWSARDIAGGIADLAIYPLLRDRGVPLYLHPRIHLKLYVFANNVAFLSSANATGRGLGTLDDPNVEIGVAVTLATSDWSRLYELFDASIRVNDEIYEKALKYKRDNAKSDFEALPELILAPATDISHSISSLPVSPGPEKFAAWHANPADVPPAEFPVYAHDRALYRVPERLSKLECLDHLRGRFREHRFIQDLAAFLRTQGSAPFGAVKAWLQAHCSDRPLPYRWELTANTRVLYDWLAYFFEEVSWYRPRYSMVIRWTPSTNDKPKEPPRR